MRKQRENGKQYIKHVKKWQTIEKTIIIKGFKTIHSMWKREVYKKERKKLNLLCTII